MGGGEASHRGMGRVEKGNSIREVGDNRGREWSGGGGWEGRGGWSVEGGIKWGGEKKGDSKKEGKGICLLRAGLNEVPSRGPSKTLYRPKRKGKIGGEYHERGNTLVLTLTRQRIFLGRDNTSSGEIQGSECTTLKGKSAFRIL